MTIGSCVLGFVCFFLVSDMLFEKESASSDSQIVWRINTSKISVFSYNLGTIRKIKNISILSSHMGFEINVLCLPYEIFKIL